MFSLEAQTTGQIVRSFKHLTGQNPFLTGHICPLTGRYFKP